ncbi:MAG TPA: NAD(P)-dependent oxidoreductase [Acidobacteriota bacterium]|nr:NAD(P)-dependent oxidoreductase [Acidobacteriota bacterium]
MSAIAFFDCSGSDKAFFQKELRWKTKTTFFTDSVNEQHLQKIADAEVVSSFYKSKWTSQLLGRLPNLKLILLRCTGFDNVDMEYCNARGIAVCNVPVYGDNTVAEHTFALLLALAKHLPTTISRTRAGSHLAEEPIGFDLKGKVIGVIGGGKIGMNVVKIAHGFGMYPLVYDMAHQDFLTQILDFQYASVDDILKKADIISLHLPHVPNTHHILNKRAFKLMKKGVILINTARGELIDTSELLSNVVHGKIAAAGLDVIEEEDVFVHPSLAITPQSAELLAFNRQLISHPNVIYTAHNAYRTQEAMERILRVSLENLMAYKNKQPQNVVNQKKVTPSSPR